MFNGAGFNNLKFNQSGSEYEVKSQDNLSIQTEFSSELGVEIQSDDILLVAVEESTELEISNQVIENWQLYFVEGIDVYSETSGLDPPVIYLEESAQAGTGFNLTDSLAVGFGQEMPLGFNNQGFNQLQGTYLRDGEEAGIEILVEDSLSTEIEEESDQINYISANDDFKIIIDKERYLDKEVFVEDGLEVEIKETSYVASSVAANDNLSITFEEQADLLSEFYSNDNIDLNIDVIESEVSGILKYLINGEFKTILHGYVLVNGKWRRIVEVSGMVENRWRKREF